MRTRIIELEDELAQQEQRPAKRARTSGGAAEPQALASTSTVPSAAVTKAEEKKRKAQVKKVFDRYCSFFIPFDVLIPDPCAV